MTGIARQLIDLRHEPEHITTLARWHHEEWSHLNPGVTLQQRIEYMKASLGDSLIPSTYIYKLGYKLAGSASLVMHDLPSRMELSPWLASVFVRPEFRKQGIGSELVQKIMDVANNARIPELYLFTPDKEGFYLRLGWMPLFREEYHGTGITVMKTSF